MDYLLTALILCFWGFFFFILAAIRIKDDLFTMTDVLLTLILFITCLLVLAVFIEFGIFFYNGFFNIIDINTKNLLDFFLNEVIVNFNYTGFIKLLSVTGGIIFSLKKIYGQLKAKNLYTKFLVIFSIIAISISIPHVINRCNDNLDTILHPNTSNYLILILENINHSVYIIGITSFIIVWFYSTIGLPKGWFFRWLMLIAFWLLISTIYTIYTGVPGLDVSNAPVNIHYVLVTFISKCGFILATVVWHITLLNSLSVNFINEIYMLFNINISRQKYALQLILSILVLIVIVIISLNIVTIIPVSDTIKYFGIISSVLNL